MMSLRNESCPVGVTSMVGLALTAFALSPAQAEQSPDRLWRELAGHEVTRLGEVPIVAAHQRLVELDPGALDVMLAMAPLEGSVGAEFGPSVELSLPLPDGGFARFAVEQSPIVEPELATRFPELRTYRAVGIDVAATARFSVTPHGFHAQIFAPDGRVFIDPYRPRERFAHIVYFTRDAIRPEGVDFHCEVHGELEPILDTEGTMPEGGTLDLRTYRTAVAATGEYTTFHSAPNPSNVADGLAAIVIAMNRVNGIYEREVAIRMVLVANNDLVVYTNGGTDPYSNNSGGTMLGQNQTNLDLVIGSANYDIGHVFSTGGGGVASLGVPCRASLKARGVTGLPSPTGDVFWVDFVAHEMGHQWGANHTFNGNASNCSGGNRNASTAYEPGSASTIMGYAGICGAHNIQNFSDDYFHAISLAEIVAYSRSGLGNGCPGTIVAGNTPPVADAGPSFTIPTGTPFALCGAGSDADDDPLTFNWEQWNLGAAGHPNSPVGDAPIFRSFPATPYPGRTFPRWSDILSNTQTLGEILPSYARTLSFRLTVRDNALPAGAFGHANTQVVVVNTGGPFLVTAPNTGAVVWPVGSSQTVSWDPAGTAAAPISCAAVDILLSVDGGANFPVTLLGGAPNNGSASITVPAAATTTARVMVRCASPGANIFFDVSNANFSITGAGELIFASNFESCRGLAEWD